MSENIPSYEDSLNRAFGDVISDVDAATQCLVLALSVDEIEGKSILEIGSGQTNRFAREVIEEFPTTQVVTINPQLAFEKLIQERNIPIELHQGGIAALAQGGLPFKDESFDTIVSVMAVPNTLKTPELPLLFNDVWRVLKPGGVAKLWPVYVRSNVYGISTPPEFMHLEPVDKAVLAGLQPNYRNLDMRIVIRKPNLSSEELPSEIARLYVK